jgi:hypothetical protein
LQTLPDLAPAFLNPIGSLALTAGVATPLGLTLADDPAVALGLLGAAPELLQVTLLASSGVLLLDPGTALGIGIAGDATGAITLSATSTEFAALNAALAAVTLDSGVSGTLRYVASQTGGPLPLTDTSGSFSYSASGTVAVSTETWRSQTANWQTPDAWSGTATPGLGTAVTIGTGAIVHGFGVASGLDMPAGAIVDFEAQLGVGSATLGSASTLLLGDAALSVAGTIGIDAASLMIGSDAALVAGAMTIGAGGALFNFGTAVLGGAEVIGDVLLPGGAVLGGVLGVGSGGFVDFSGTLQANQMAGTTGITAISLAADATIAGAGTA